MGEVPGDGHGSRRGCVSRISIVRALENLLGLPYPSCAAEEQEYEGDYDEDAPACHDCMRFGEVYVCGGWSYVQGFTMGRVAGAEGGEE